MPKGFRKNISIPGLLDRTAKQRCSEFGDAGFVPYVVELGYDLRAAAHHAWGELTRNLGENILK